MWALTRITCLQVCVRPSLLSIGGRQSTIDGKLLDPLLPLLEGDFFKDDDDKRQFKKDLVANSAVSKNKKYGSLLKALANSTQVVELDHGIKAISVDKSQLGGLTSPFGLTGVGSHVLFERSFYNDLLAEVCGRKDGVALIGSAGTSKSTWLYWYLYKVMQAVEQGINLPSNNSVAEGCPPPELIVYQRGSENVLYFLTRDKIAYRAKSIDTCILDLFDTRKVVYLVEPLTTKQEPQTVPDLFTMIAASPDPIRYKEFLKTRDPLYMPTYEEEELVTIGKYLQGLVLRDKEGGGLTEPKAAELLELYSEEAVRKRFEVYGGIIRRVLPSSKESQNKVGEQLDASLQSLLTKKLGDIDSITEAVYSDTTTTIGSYIVQWNPRVLSVDANDESKKHYHFGSKTVGFASPHVQQRVEIVCGSMSFNELKRKLKGFINSDRNGLIPILLETYLFKYLSEEPGHFSSAMKGLPTKGVTGVRGKPSYSTMETNYIYYPHSNHNFPAVEMYVKVLGELLYAIQLSKTQKSRKNCTNLALAKFLQAIGMSPEDALSKLRIVYCRLHEKSEWQLSYWKPPSSTKKDDKKTAAEIEAEGLMKEYQLHDENAALAKAVLENVIYVDFDEDLSVSKKMVTKSQRVRTKVKVQGGASE